jgi:hypothetical protein
MAVDHGRSTAPARALDRSAPGGFDGTYHGRFNMKTSMARRHGVRTLLPASFPALTLCASLAGASLFTGGCEGRVSMLPNSDKSLRRPPSEFAADAANRHPFRAELPSGGEAVGRAQVGYQVDQLEISNLSDEDWDDADIWVNREYVVHIPHIAAGDKRVKTINFQMLYDGQGHHFPTDNERADHMINQLEMVRGGKIYTIPLKLAD